MAMSLKDVYLGQDPFDTLLDVVIADTPAPPHVRVKVFNHLLGESDITFFAAPALAARLRRRFDDDRE